MQSAELPNARTALRTLMEIGETELYADLVVGLRSLWRVHGDAIMDSQLELLAGGRTCLPGVVSTCFT